VAARTKRKGAYRKVPRPKRFENRSQWSEYKEHQFHVNVCRAGTIKWTRIEADVTQKELARVLRVSAGCVGTRESGRNNLTAEQVKQHLEAIQLIQDRRK